MWHRDLATRRKLGERAAARQRCHNCPDFGRYIEDVPLDYLSGGGSQLPWFSALDVLPLPDFRWWIEDMPLPEYWWWQGAEMAPTEFAGLEDLLWDGERREIDMTANVWWISWEGLLICDENVGKDNIHGWCSPSIVTWNEEERGGSKLTPVGLTASFAEPKRLHL
jgi:hypothetical protein